MPSTITDFDFLMGQWCVRHRRLTRRLQGCEDWQSFEGTCTAQKILGGAGNIDDNVLELPSGTYRAISLRTFVPTTGLWSIWWLDGHHPERLDAPVVGSFHDNVGIFFADDMLAGRAIRVRFRWTEISTGFPHWEQAFSADNGASWEINWTMDFRPASDLAL